ncbi:DNA replication/repair protein RecF [Nocardioides marmoraquaticus]
MHVAHLSLHDFRSYPDLELALEPGVSSLVGRNGQGKTNVVEAVDYLSRLSSHRVSGDAPLVRQGADRAVVRAAVVREDRTATLEVEINPGKSNRARVNRAALPRARDLVGLVRTVVFAPDDLALVKGDPSERRRFADDLQVLATPRYAGTRADYDRVLKQRSSLLRSARVRGGSAAEAMLATLEVWDERLAALGTEVMLRRAALVDELVPLLGKAYEAVARGARRDDAVLAYRPSFEVDPGAGPAEVEQAFLAELARRRRDEVDRGVTLVGPHRDELVCTLGELPVKGYASHGEGWSFALALRLASYELLRQPTQGVEGGAAGHWVDDPILVLDDVFAELDATRRAQLADLVVGAEQVLVTAAVADDVPEALRGRRYDVADGQVVAHG